MSSSSTVATTDRAAKKNARNHRGRLKNDLHKKGETELTDGLIVGHDQDEVGRGEAEDEEEEDGHKAKRYKPRAANPQEDAKSKGKDGKPFCILVGAFVKDPAVPIFVLRRRGIYKKGVGLRF